MEKKKKFILTLIGTIIFEIGLGSFFFISNLNVYITSYIHIKQKFITMHYGNFFSTIMDFGSHLNGLLSGYIENKYGYKTAMIIGNIIIIICSIIFFFQQNIFITYLLLFFFGCGIGICLNVPIKNVCYYLPKKKGFINSIIGNILILSSSFFIFIGEKFINYDGYTLKIKDNFYPENIALRTPYYFIIVIIIVPVCTFLSLIFIYKFENDEDNFNNNNNKKDQLFEENENDISNCDDKVNNNIVNDKENNIIDKQSNINDNSNNDLIEEEKSENDEFNIPVKKEEKKEEEEKKESIEKEQSTKINYKKDLIPILKSSKFYRLIGIICFQNFLIKFILSTFRTFGAIIGIKGSLFKYLSILMSTTNIISGPIWGILIDKINAKIVFIIMGLILLFISISFQIFIESQIMFIFLIILNVIVMGGFHSIIYPHVIEVFGIKYSIEINGVISIFSGFVGIFVSVLSFVVSLFYDNENIQIPYKNIYLFGGFLDLFSILLSLNYNTDNFLHDKTDEKNENFENLELELENL
jgi:MFS family permease